MAPSMLETPYFVCDGGKLRENCEVVAEVRKLADAKVLFAIKSFTSCGVFPHMAPYFDGVVASSLYEARIGRDYFRTSPNDHREVHTYSPGFRDADIEEVIRVSDTIVFNSQTQQARFGAQVRAAKRGLGLRLNPDLSDRSDLASGLNFCSQHSRMGVRREFLRPEGLEQLDGVLFHVNSENGELARFEAVLHAIEQKFADVLGLPNVRWISLGGGISFTNPGYPIAAFAQALRAFADRWQAKVVLEPGTAISSRPFSLHATVLDVIQHELPIAVLDISAEAHLPDRLMFDIRYPIVGAQLCGDEALAKPAQPDQPGYVHMVGGVSCLGSDELGLYRFDKPLAVGDQVELTHTGDYTIVQQTFFNGVRRPSVYFRHESGELELLKKFGYEDFLALYA